MPYEQVKTSLKPPQPKPGIDLKAAYQALMTGYQRTHGSSVSRKLEKQGPDRQGERNDQVQI